MSQPLTLDVRFLGHPQVIASALVEATSGLILVDPGPTSSLGGLEASLAAVGKSLDQVRALLLTHIHLDHAGATGTLLREYPDIEVHVHERGAPHLVDPSKLLQSAGRLYGDQMQRLWGDFLPVPAERVRVLGGGERLEVAGDVFDVRYTPGHASHHVSYFHEASGTAFVGDTGGIRIGPPLFVVAPTPPPDIDLEAWDASIDAIGSWRPARLFLTHFGAFEDVEAHLGDLRRRMHEQAESVRATLEVPEATEAQGVAAYTEGIRSSLLEIVGEDEEAIRRVQRAVPFDHCWMGLKRYWNKRTARTGGSSYAGPTPNAAS